MLAPPAPDSGYLSQVQHISAITNNPRAGLMDSIYSLFTETLSDLSYTPDMTEESVMPSPLLPQVDSDSFSTYYKALSKVFGFVLLSRVATTTTAQTKNCVRLQK